MHLYYLPIRKAPENCECQLDAGRLKVWPESIAPLLDIGLDRDETDCINLGLSHADESADYSTWYVVRLGVNHPVCSRILAQS